MFQLGLNHQLTLNFRLFICKRLQNPSFRWHCFINGMSSHNYWAVVSNNELRNTGKWPQYLYLLGWIFEMSSLRQLFFKAAQKSVLEFLGKKNKSHTRKIKLFLYWHGWQICIQKYSASGLFLCFLNSIRLNKVNRNKVRQEIICYNWYLCVNGISKS